MDKSVAEKPKSLTDQVKNLVKELANARKRVVTPLQMPFSGEQFCVVCKMPRLDPDPTGVTCGSPTCLASAANDAVVASNLLRDQVIKVGKDYDIENSDPEEVLIQLGNRLDEFAGIESKLEELLTLLGIEGSDLDPLEVVDKVLAQVKEIQDSIASVKPVPNVQEVV